MTYNTVNMAERKAAVRDRLALCRIFLCERAIAIILTQTAARRRCEWVDIRIGLDADLFLSYSARSEAPPLSRSVSLPAPAHAPPAQRGVQSLRTLLPVLPCCVFCAKKSRSTYGVWFVAGASNRVMRRGDDGIIEPRGGDAVNRRWFVVRWA